ncbi:MAG: aminodeoxychorismate synthase component I [Pseudomonadota bacterium]
MTVRLDSAAPFALFDDSLTPPAEARCLLLADFEYSIETRGPEEVAVAFARMEAALAAGRHLAIEACYELGYWLEAKLRGLARPGSRPLLAAHVFGRAHPLDGAQVAQLLAEHIATLDVRSRICGVADLQPAMDEADYLAAVARILDYIRAGDCYQVNFTFPLSLRHYGSPVALYARLRRAQPVRHGALLHLPGRDLLSLSPELFVARRGRRLTARPMKGTAPRRADPRADAQQARRLAESDKERAENVMIVDLIRNDLGRLARPGSVRVERLFEVEAYPSVWQMTSTVSAEAPHAGLEQVFRALFPCGSVTGAPKIRAMEIAAELERGPRGVYTGALGHAAPGGDFSLNVAIRTLVLEGDGSGCLGVGSGIVADSRPELELAECRLKAAFLTGIEADFQLIETLLLDTTDPHLYPLLDDHLQRLAGSARYFGFAWDPQALRATLLARGRAAGPGRHRVRLLLDKAGNPRIEAAPLPAGDEEELAVVLARRTVDSRDLFRYHKTTVRHDYEAELAQLPAGVFDALFCNERGELCEGARSNLYLSLGGVLHTPPVSAGLLDGVMRRRLLRSQPLPIVERTLHPEDLARAEAVYISNGVRGLRRVRLLSS